MALPLILALLQWTSTLPISHSNSSVSPEHQMIDWHEKLNKLTTPQEDISIPNTIMIIIMASHNLC